jgi:hypothetical protein
LINQLQTELDLAESQVIDMMIFQTQAVEIRRRIEMAQQSLLAKIEIIQDHVQLVDQALDQVTLREGEARVARSTFQEAVTSATKEEVAIASRLSIKEQTRGNILLTAWEHDISENRKRAKEVRDSCEEIFGSINKNLLELDREASAGTLGKINIAKHLLDIKESMERDQAELSQVSQVDIAQIDKWLIKPNLLLLSIMTEDRQVGGRIPQLDKKRYLFEANDQVEPSKSIAQLVERCLKCIEHGQGKASGSK